jgi:hypothetical protein
MKLNYDNGAALCCWYAQIKQASGLHLQGALRLLLPSVVWQIAPQMFMMSASQTILLIALLILLFPLFFFRHFLLPFLVLIHIIFLPSRLFLRVRFRSI